MNDTSTLPIGAVIAGRYEILSRIADGGMATVYLGRDNRLDRNVAVKIMHADLARDSESRRRFLQEALSSAKLQHPNVVSIYDHGEDADLPYIAMEYLPGLTLRQLLKDRGHLSVRESLAVIISILSGLAAAHRAGIIHRDLKPENIILSDDGRIKVADFGLARPADNHTDSGESLFGTVAYLSPELVNRSPADSRSDVYAIGIMLYEMLTGKQPFTGEQPVQVAMQHLNTPIPLPSASVEDIPESVDDLVLWASSKDPDERPRDASEMLARARIIAQQLTPNDAQATRVLPVTPTTALTTVLDGPTPTAVLPQDTTAATDVLDSDVVDNADIFEPLDDDDDAGTPETATSELARRAGRRRRTGWIWFGIVLVLAAAAAAVAWYFALGPGARIKVPDIVGTSAAAATATLREQSFTVARSHAYSLTVDKGIVIRSSPQAGAMRPRNARVMIVVSLGPSQKPLPEVIGLPSNTAQLQLQNSGFTVDQTIDTAYTADVPSNNVIRIYANEKRVNPGDKLPEGTQIKLLVSRGAVPDLSGQTQDAATQQIESLDLEVGKVAKEFSDDVPEGTVISSSPAKSILRPGGKVNLVVSKGQQLIAVPDTTNMTVQQAVDAINNAGLTADTQLPQMTWGMAHTQSTDPGAGTQVPKGTKVTITGSL